MHARPTLYPAVLLALTLFPACVFDSTGLTLRRDLPAPEDQSQPLPDRPLVHTEMGLPDLPQAERPVDGIQPDRPQSDLTKPDLTKPDLTKPDLTKPDLFKPDLTKPDLTKQTCSQRYGSAPSFYLCSETATQCRFYVDTDGSNCQVLCNSMGGSCTSACNDGSNNCQCAGGSWNCTNEAYSQICTCTRP